eukprot:8210-Eustigmatos_ZCMA.PRE.1
MGSGFLAAKGPPHARRVIDAPLQRAAIWLVGPGRLLSLPFRTCNEWLYRVAVSWFAAEAGIVWECM